jgi:hypothetical protein
MITSAAKKSGSLNPDNLNTVAYSALTNRIVSIGAQLQLLMAESAALEQAAQKKPLSRRKYKTYLDMRTALNEIDCLFWDLNS